MADYEETGVHSKKERSPSFPFISLAKAIDRAEELRVAHKRAPARLAQVGPTWGYGPKSSGLLQTVAALKQYGLIDDLGSGEDRRIVLSELGWKILVDTRPGAREDALRQAALSPRLLRDFYDRWMPDRPSDAHCVSELHLDYGFTQESAKTFLRVFDETVAFANLRSGDNLSLSGPDSDAATPQREVLAVDSQTHGSIARPTSPPGVNRATFPLPEGVAALELPKNLSAESFEDLQAWVEVLMRQAKRSVVDGSTNSEPKQ